MYSRDVLVTDSYLGLPHSTKTLYTFLNLEADDDGFVSNPNTIIKMVDATEDDMRLLIEKDYVLFFQSGVIVITDWTEHNLIRKDRKKTTRFIEEYNQLTILENGKYRLKNSCQSNDNQTTTTCQPNDNQQGNSRLHSKGKDSIEKDKLDDSLEDKIPSREIIDYLNKVANKNYRHDNNKTKTLIKARWNEGFRVNDFKKVIDIKSSEWLSNDKMSKFLRPETLFGTKFESYLNEAPKNNNAHDPNSDKFKGVFND